MGLNANLGIVNVLFVINDEEWRRFWGHLLLVGDTSQWFVARESSAEQQQRLYLFHPPTLWPHRPQLEAHSHLKLVLVESMQPVNHKKASNGSKIRFLSIYQSGGLAKFMITLQSWRDFHYHIYVNQRFLKLHFGFSKDLSWLQLSKHSLMIL